MVKWQMHEGDRQNEVKPLFAKIIAHHSLLLYFSYAQLKTAVSSLPPL